MVCYGWWFIEVNNRLVFFLQKTTLNGGENHHEQGLDRCGWFHHGVPHVSPSAIQQSGGCCPRLRCWLTDGSERWWVCSWHQLQKNSSAVERSNYSGWTVVSSEDPTFEVGWNTFGGWLICTNFLQWPQALWISTIIKVSALRVLFVAVCLERWEPGDFVFCRT